MAEDAVPDAVLLTADELGRRVMGGGEMIHVGGPASDRPLRGSVGGEPPAGHLMTAAASYLGLPMLGDDGQPLGALAVLDVRHREWTEAEIATLTELAGVAVVGLSNRAPAAGQPASEPHDATRDGGAVPDQPEAGEHPVGVSESPAAAETEARFRALTELTSDWIWEVDAAGRYTYASPQVRALLGYEPHEVLGKTPFDLMPPGEAEAVREIFEDHLSAGRAFACLENVNLRRDGSLVVLETSGVPVLAPDGTVQGYRGIDRDITRRKMAERALRASEERLALALAASQHGLWDRRLDTGEVYYSPQWMTMLGYGSHELPQDHAMFMRLIHPDDLPRVEEALSAMVRTSSSPEASQSDYALEFRMRTKDGGWKWILSRGDVVERDGGGAPLRVSGTHEDVTDRKSAELELRRQATHDALTGLANRAHFEARVTGALAAPATAGGRVVLFVDLDNFKEINDELGHAAGDELLIAAAARVAAATRGSDSVARLGGDEFAVLLTSVRDEDAAMAVAERIVASLAVPIAIGDERVVAPASVGVAIARPGDSAADLIRHADVAMYRAKAEGRGRAVMYAPELLGSA